MGKRIPESPKFSLDEEEAKHFPNSKKKVSLKSIGKCYNGN